MYTQGFTTSAAIVLFIGLHSQIGFSNTDLEFVLDAHDTALQRIVAVDATIVSTRTLLNGSSIVPQKLSSCDWTEDYGAGLSRQRITQFDLAPDEDGRVVDFADLLEDGEQSKVILNWNPTRPYKLHPWRQGSLKAHFEPMGSLTHPRFSNPDCSFALLRIQLQQADARRTLRDLVRESGSVKVEKDADVDGHSCWAIHIAHPHSRTRGEFSGARFSVYLDPQVSFLVRKCISFDIDPAPRNPQTCAIETHRMVKEFRGIGDGIFFPEVVEVVSYARKLLSDKPNQVLRFEAQKLRINSPIDPAVFEFVYPENALVYRYPVEHGKHNVWLWGPDNKPLKQIVEQSDLGPLPVSGDEGTGLARIIWLVVAASLVSVLLAAGYRWFRR